jgi:hypothetical protein
MINKNYNKLAKIKIDLFNILDKIYLNLNIKDRESYSKISLKFEKDLNNLINIK